MKVEGVEIAQEHENALEEFMLTNSFTARRASEEAARLVGGTLDDAVPYRLADRLIQRLRRTGKITNKRVRCRGTVWSAA